MFFFPVRADALMLFFVFVCFFSRILFFLMFVESEAFLIKGQYRGMIF